MENKDPKHSHFANNGKVLASISRDRNRTNLLRRPEQNLIAFLVQRIPSWISSDMLTAFGLCGNALVMAGFILATYVGKPYLLLGILGFAINWFGDSLDGRLAYYRNKPKKLYGFVLDITVDWTGIILIGCGYIVYAEGAWELLGYAFVLLYGWEIILALMRYRITGEYSIDFGILGPTEVRIILASMLVLELLVDGSIEYLALFITLVLLFINFLDTTFLLRISKKMDIRENSRSQQSSPESDVS